MFKMQLSKMGGAGLEKLEEAGSDSPAVTHTTKKQGKKTKRTNSAK